MRIAVVPAKNEQKNLPGVIKDIRDRVDLCLVVDDGSEDETGDAARSLGCVVLRNDHTTGYGAALRKGIAHCCALNATTVVTIDADGQHEGEWINRSAPLAGQVDVVFANRFAIRDGIPETKLLSNNFAWDCVRRLIGRPPVCEDVSCGLRVYSRRGALAALDTPSASTSGYAFSQASCAFLHQSGLRLAALETRAIYKEPVFGTATGELRDFFQWLVESTSLQDEGKEWLSRLNQNLPLTFDIEGWRASGRQRLIAQPNGNGFYAFLP